MSVKHFQSIAGGDAICGTKGKSPEFANNVNLITCKKCLKILDKMENPTPKKKKSTTIERTIPKNLTKRKKPKNLKFIDDRKWGYCLQVNASTLLKLGENLNDKITIMTLITDSGIMSTSMQFYNVNQILSIKESNYLRGWFINHKMHNGGKVLISEVKEAFEKK